ncbi:serine/threonine-protein kinase HipA [Chitinophaga jiangningensis]|uniref:Serine/threonine-protein kinase HipA n=1 Tax=Chitinophaga jiangningensis TaxID=1419482 RepID=A0A1M6VQ14_9BACT|nr:HipA N-terminal domain-containing protein [Chitinophaga jiangningensis]SHK83622.1 serine/threonine-protein kinase HipA [Chitinophaga jiangningensis]
MQKGEVYYNNILAGILEKRSSEDYRFTYDDAYMENVALPSISVTLPKKQKEHFSPLLFSFFAGLLAEGINKSIQCRLLKIDENDDFTRLLKTANVDTIGAITINEITEN